MAKHTDRVRIEEVDWLAVFPWLRLVGAFRMAIHPTKLLTALLLVTVLFAAGRLLDLAFGSVVYPGEVDQYRQTHFGLQPPERLEAWLKSRDKPAREALRELLRTTPGSTPGFKPGGDIDAIVKGDRPFDEARDQLHAHYAKAYADKQTDRELQKLEKDWDGELRAIRISRQRALATVASLRPRGTFETALHAGIDAFDRLVRATATLNFGWSQTVGAAPPGIPAMEPDATGEGDALAVARGSAIGYYDETTVAAALRDLFIVLPAWLWAYHRDFLLAYLPIALLAWSLLGGAIARMAAVQATRDDRIGLREAMRFVMRRWWSFLLSPLAPLGALLLVAALMGLGGFVFFNLKAWGIDILGGVLFIIAILCGFIVAATLVLTAAGIHLAYPATAVDGADVFDAIARAFNYVLNRPWRWLFCSLLSLVYGAVMYLLLALLLFLSLWAIQKFVGVWVFTETDVGGNRFETILPRPAFNELAYEIDYAALDWSGRIAAFIIRCWMFLVIGLLAAFGIGYYFSANTWVYLLLRRSADGVEFEDLLVDPPGDAAPAKVIPPDKVEPGAGAASDDAQS